MLFRRVRRSRVIQFRSRSFPGALFWVIVFLSSAWAGAQVSRSAAPRPSPQDINATPLDRVAPYRRCLWVTRWDYRTPEDIEKICYNAASARFTDLLFQVRGEATVFYASRVEPWAWELSGADSPAGVGRDPGWDPLAKALREAHRWGLRLHAYLNVMPGWAQATPPPRQSGQILAVHPEWFMIDRRGRPMTARHSYAFVDPGLAEVRNHLSQLIAELAARYKVDGIHLDYIRYPFEQGDYSYRPSVVGAFKAALGGAPAAKPRAWDQFRRNQLTEMLRTIRRAVEKARPGLELSAAVIADEDTAQNRAFQSPKAWLAEGLLDAVAPMAYHNDMRAFESLCRPFEDQDLRKRVWLGVIADPEKNSHLAEQVRRAAGAGFGAVAVFDYGSLFPDHRPSSRARSVFEVFTGEKQQP